VEAPSARRVGRHSLTQRLCEAGHASNAALKEGKERPEAAEQVQGDDDERDPKAESAHSRRHADGVLPPVPHTVHTPQ
jgi:hypothetical protein